MAKTDTLLALSVIRSDELKCSPQQLAALQQSVVTQAKTIGRMRHEEALRSLFVGIALHRIKDGLGHGKFGAWYAESLPGFGSRWVNYLMRLALVFIEVSHAKKAELALLPADETPLTLDTLEGDQRVFVKRAIKFIGEHTLSELLEEYGIKDTKQIGGARTAGGKPAPAVTDPQQLYLFARDEIGDALERVDTLFIKENRLQYLLGHPDELRGAVGRLRELADKVEASAKKTLKQ